MTLSLEIQNNSKYARSKILVIDDEEDIGDLISNLLESKGYSVTTVLDADSAIKLMHSQTFDLVLLDLWLVGSELDGLCVLEFIRDAFPNLPVVVISGHGTASTATTALHMGAYDYLEKPFLSERLSFVINQAIEVARLKRENEEYKTSKDTLSIIGNSHATRTLKNTIEKVARTSSRVLIYGQFGSGKGVVAMCLHESSKSYNSPFIVIHQSLFSDKSYMINIFGKEGERNPNLKMFLPPKLGLIEQANNGTLFLDEISDFPQDVQLRLLQLVNDGVIRREGGSRKIKVNLRVITSLSSNSLDEEDISTINKDLFYRLSVVKIKIPSLKERREDIPLICEFMMDDICKKTKKKRKKITQEAMAIFQSYNWPGNFRQLRNILEWLNIMSQSDTIVTSDIPEEISSNSPMKDFFNTKIISSPLREAREEFEKRYLETQLIRFNGNISKTAEFVGMERSALHRKLRSLGVNQKPIHQEESC